MYPKVDRAKELIAAGVIGRPVLAEAASHDWFYPTDGQRAWLIDPKLAGGGPLYDIASHRIDLMNYFFGEPQYVCGRRSTLVHPIGVEDNSTVMIDYRSGVRGLVDVRWHSKVARDEFRIRGTEGEMNLTPLNGPLLTYPGVSENVPPHDNLHYPCIANFAAAVLDGAPLRSSGASASITDWVTEQVMTAN
jgi:predicted dehydrogenase